MLKDWIEVWDGEQYLLININNISVIKTLEDKTHIIMNNGDVYKVETPKSQVYDKIHNSRRCGI